LAKENLITSCLHKAGLLQESLLIHGNVDRISSLHCVSKNMPTLASCSFDKRGLIIIIFGKQHACRSYKLPKLARFFE